MTQRLTLVRSTDNEFLVASEAGNLSMVERQLGNTRWAEALAQRRPWRSAGAHRRRVHQAVRRSAAFAAIATERGDFERAGDPRRRGRGASWRPSTWPGRRTNGRTTSGCSRILPEAMGRTNSNGVRARAPRPIAVGERRPLRVRRLRRASRPARATAGPARGPVLYSRTGRPDSRPLPNARPAASAAPLQGTAA